MNAQTMIILQDSLDKLKPSARPFAQSLLTQYKKYGKLSEKQALWADKLVDDIECYGVPDFTALFAPAEPDYVAIVAFMQAAGKKMKYPAVTLQFKNGHPLKIALNGSSSSKAGAVSLTDGGSYGNNKFYGRIDKDGKFEPYTASVPVKDELTSILAKFASDPVALAAEHGKTTGRCCFCNTGLTDPKSTAVGFGPQCAKQWGLPWGKTAMDEAIEKMPSAMAATMQTLVAGLGQKEGAI